MIAVEKLVKSFGHQQLFVDASFKVNPRERIGLVGRNGHGKTTLLRILVGETLPDAGTVTIPRQYRIGQVTQKLAFSCSTVLAEAMTGLSAAESDHHWKAERILAGLGFDPRDMQRHPETFSGGYQVRLNLAKVLVGEPDMLLLDEPTNYLDITSIRWVIGFLRQWPRELMVVTHDRGFMDSIITHTLGIHRGQLKKVRGDTRRYYEQIAQEESIHEKTRLNDEKRRREIELFISRFRAKARLANMVQSRIKTLSKMEKKDKLVKLKNLAFQFRSRPTAAKEIGRVADLTFGYRPDRPLIQDFNLTVRNGDRIGVIGPNGRGKTTLLKLLAGRLTPQGGGIQFHKDVVAGVYEQSNVQVLVDERTIEEELLLADPDIDRQTARNICGAMLFSGDDALKKISVLSGGEKCRVMLGRILATPVNLLLLDEPTNHLDMESCDALLAAIDDFAGAVVMVTHNEMFLHALAERLVVFHRGGVDVFETGYQGFLDDVGWEEPGSAPATPDARQEKEDNDGPSAAIDRKLLKKQRSALIAQRSSQLGPLRRRLEKLETDIETREAELERINGDLVAASQGQESERIADLSKAAHSCQRQIDTLYEDYEALTGRIDRCQAEFDRRLAQLAPESG